MKVIHWGLLQVMESVLRFVFIEHLNNVKSAKYWGPDAPRLVFQFEVSFTSLVDQKPALSLTPLACLTFGFSWATTQSKLWSQIFSNTNCLFHYSVCVFLTFYVGGLAKVEPDLVMELVHAAHFLGIKSLLNVAATMVAHHLAGLSAALSYYAWLAHFVRFFYTEK